MSMPISWIKWWDLHTPDRHNSRTYRKDPALGIVQLASTSSRRVQHPSDVGAVTCLPTRKALWYFEAHPSFSFFWTSIPPSRWTVAPSLPHRRCVLPHVTLLRTFLPALPRPFSPAQETLERSSYVGHHQQSEMATASTTDPETLTREAGQKMELLSRGESAVWGSRVQAGNREGAEKRGEGFWGEALALTLQPCPRLALYPLNPDPAPQTDPRAASPPWPGPVWGSCLSPPRPRAAPLGSRGLAWVREGLPSPLVPQCPPWLPSALLG